MSIKAKAMSAGWRKMHHRRNIMKISSNNVSEMWRNGEAIEPANRKCRIWLIINNENVSASIMKANDNNR
jgi:hypothetical protein